jgi:hypothetical protein
VTSCWRRDSSCPTDVKADCRHIHRGRPPRLLAHLGDRARSELVHRAKSPTRRWGWNVGRWSTDLDNLLLGRSLGARLRLLRSGAGSVLIPITGATSLVSASIILGTVWEPGWQCRPNVITIRTQGNFALSHGTIERCSVNAACSQRAVNDEPPG